MPKILITLLALSISLGGCLYRQPVFQGNLLESKNVEQLKVGMTKRQVFALLGTPSVADPFHAARWDYVASERRGHGDTVVKTFTLYFDAEALARWEGEYFPEQDLELSVEMRKFGNLPRDDKKRR